MKLPARLQAWLPAALAVALVPLTHGQDFYMISKNQNYRQTAANTVVPDPIVPFEVEINGAVNLSVTLPSGIRAAVPFRYDEDAFRYEQAFATKAAMDAVLPAGTYQLNGVGIPTVSLNVPESYASATPQVLSVTNGTWNAGGVLVVNPTQPTTITFPLFSEYNAAGTTGYLRASIWGFTEQDDIVSTEIVSRPIVDLLVQATPITSITIPANRLVNGRIYGGTIDFQRVPVVDTTSINNSVVVSVLGKSVEFFIAAQTNATSPAAPTVTNHPANRTVAAGGSTAFAANVTIPEANRGNIAIWYKDGFEPSLSPPRSIRAPNGQTLTINSLNLSDAGTYVLEVVSAGGVVRTNPATLTIPVVPGIARLSNLSVFTSIGSGDAFSMGYVVGGPGTSGTKPLVIRAAGPSLSAINVSGALDDPKLELFAGSAKTADNDNWGGGQALADGMAAVGAFPFTGAASRDAATLANITSADNSVRVSAAGNGSGLVLAEVYDATPTASFTATTPRLVNVSVLKHIGSGLSIGFVIDGSAEKTVLVRAIGPTLGAAPFNYPGVVADPQLSLHSTSMKISENNDWTDSPAMTAAFQQVSAFALPAKSKDAALLATLPPGNYSVQVSGVGSTTGNALIEVYELP